MNEYIKWAYMGMNLEKYNGLSKFEVIWYVKKDLENINNMKKNINKENNE